MARGNDPEALHGLAGLDGELIRRVDQAWSAAAKLAGDHVACRKGCTPCCLGVFDITALDVWRLRRGLEILRDCDELSAAEIVSRAERQWAFLSASFPGEVVGGLLWADDRLRERFFDSHQDLPCPVLDPTSGECLLYEHRPISCRTFGLPVQVGTTLLPPCHLNFGGRVAGPEVEAAIVTPDPDDREGLLLSTLAAAGAQGDTIVASALAGETQTAPSCCDRRSRGDAAAG